MESLGPLQKADIDVIQALIRMIDAKVAVEFGFLFGDSAKAILEALSSDGKLYSYDINPLQTLEDSRFTLIKKSQVNFESVGKKIDFIFLDASHDFEINKKTFEKLIPELSDKAIVAVHDTGAWSEMIQDTGGYMTDEGYLHRPDERKFVNWIKETHPQFDQIHLHTTTKLRHGLTIIQKYKKLHI